MKKNISVLLLLAMLLTQSLTGCNGGEVVTETNAETGNTMDETTAETTLSAAEKRAATEDSLPDGLDFGGESVHIFAREETPFDYEMGVPELTGDVVNDAIYERNLAVSERLNVSISVDPTAAGNAQEAIRKYVLAGDDVYTFCVGKSFHVPHLVLEGCMLNAKDIPYLDFDMPWWIQNLNDEMTVLGQLYFISGDITLSMYQYSSMLYANMALVDEHGIEDNLYDLVMEGKWTIDKLQELVNMTSVDLNGDGTINQNDRFGLAVMDAANILAMGFAGGLHITEKNSAGIPVLAMNNAHAYDVFDKINALLTDKTTVMNPFNGSVVAADVDAKAMFINNQLLFFSGTLLDANDFRDMESEYTILPFPKYDEAQKEYATLSRDSYSIVVFPSTLGNTEMAGAVCEAMAAESYRNVTPAYIDVVLKGKYSRESTTAELVDVVLGAVTYDFGNCYSFTMGYITHVFQNAIENGEAYASRYDSKKGAAEDGLAKIIAYYEENAR